MRHEYAMAGVTRTTGRTPWLSYPLHMMTPRVSEKGFMADGMADTEDFIRSGRPALFVLEDDPTWNFFLGAADCNCAGDRRGDITRQSRPDLGGEKLILVLCKNSSPNTQISEFRMARHAAFEDAATALAASVADPLVICAAEMRHLDLYEDNVRYKEARSRDPLGAE